MIPQSFIDDLLQRVDVVDVVGRSVKLRKAGANHLGLCPFHNEKSPSFTVSPTKQFYHCFGCGAHGTAIGFLIEYGGLTFPEAVRDLAQGVGMTVPDVRRDGGSAGSAPSAGGSSEPDASGPAAIIDALERAAAFYRQALRGSKRAIAYLKGRGLTGEVAARYGMGYAPDGWNNLRAAFDEERQPVLLDAGLVIVKDDAMDRAYDRFRDRVMFPIRNGRGRVIGFGGRILDEGEPKYLNSPETPVFQKGHELYGIFEARQSIREAGFVIVVEGYMDVVALAQLGIGQAVATLGTACTAQHVQKLVRQTDRVVFSFDGDAAGRKAAWRALEAALPSAADDKVFEFLFLPAEHDPDSYIRAHGRDAFLDAVRTAQPLSEVMLSELKRGNDLGRAEGRAKLLFDARPLVRALPDGALRLQIVRTLSELSATSIDDILASFQLARRRVAHRRATARIARTPPQGLVQRALESLIMYPRIAQGLAASEIAILEDASPESRDLVVEAIDAAKMLGPEADFVAMSDALRESANGEAFEAMMQAVLALDENKRDLLLAKPPSETDVRAGERPEAPQSELRAREFHDLLRRLREQAVVAAMAALSSSGLSEEERAAEYRALHEERTRLHRSSAE